MLLIQFFIIFLCILGVRSLRDREVSVIILFFLIAYSLQLVFAEIDPFNIHTIDIVTIFFFNLQLIFFSAGAIYATRNNNIQLQKQTRETLPVININIWMLLFQLGVFLYAIYNYRRMQAFIGSQGGLTHLVRDYYYNEFFTGAGNFLNLFCEAFKLISLYFVFSILSKEKKQIKKKEVVFIIMSLLTYVLQSLTSMARGDMAALILVLLLFYFLSNKRAPESAKRLKRYFVIFVPAVFVIVAIATLYRFNAIIDGAANVTDIDNEGEMFLRPILIYFYGPILAFDYAKDSILHFDWWFFGAADLAGFIDFLLMPFIYLDHSLGSISINNIIGARMTPQFSFPSGTTWNALFTGASNYYLDFGFLGFIVFPFLHGLILSRLIQKSRVSSISMLLLVFLFFSSFYHLTSSYIQSYRIVFFLIWIFIIYRIKGISMPRSYNNGVII